MNTHRCRGRVVTVAVVAVAAVFATAACLDGGFPIELRPRLPPDAAPSLTAPATTVYFGTIGVGDFVDYHLNVHNAGVDPITVEAIELEGDLGFRPARVFEPFVVAPGADGVIVIRFEPQHAGPADATLTVWSNDLAAPDGLVFALHADVAAACIEVAPTLIDFGSARVGEYDRVAVTLRSCGDGPLEIERIAIDPASDPVFVLEIDGMPSVLASGESWRLGVAYAPTEPGGRDESGAPIRDTGLVRIDSNAAGAPAELPLRGFAF